MMCVICKKGNTRPGKATVTLVRAGTTVVIKNVPAEVCENCGEEYVEEKEAKRLLDNAEAAVLSGTLIDVREYKAA